MSPETRAQIESFYPKTIQKPFLGSRPSIRLKQKTLVHDENYKRATREGKYRYETVQQKARRSLQISNSISTGGSKERTTGKSVSIVKKSSGPSSVQVLRARTAGLKCTIKDWSIEALDKGKYILVLAENIETGECLATSAKDLSEAQTAYRGYQRQVARDGV